MLEKTLQENTRWDDQQFLWLLENMTDAFLTVNARWECGGVNYQAEEALGKTQQALVGETLWEIFPASLATSFYQKAHDVMEQRTVLPFTISYPLLNRWFTGRIVPFQTGIALFFQDTTSQLQTEHAFQQNEKRTHRLIESNIIGVIISDNEMIIEANEAFMRIVGYTKEEIAVQTLNWIQITPPEYAPLDMTRQQALLEHGTCMPYEKEYYRKDGTRVPVLIGAALLQENPFQWVCFVLDITAQKRNEEALRQQKTAFQTVAEHIPDIIMRFDPQFRHLYVNAAVTRATGRPPDEFLGKTNRDLGMPEELVRYWDRHLSDLFATGTEQMLDFAFPAPDGLRYFQAHLVPEYDIHGNITSALGISRDITAQQQAQQELRRSEKRLHVWIENVADIITILDKEGTILYQSPAIERVLGWKQEERIKQNVFHSALVHPEDRLKKQAFFTNVLHSLESTITSTFRMRHKDGSYRFIEARGRNLLASPDIQSIIATYRDVTEREELEQRKDEFMTMASHELKTPLTSLKGYTQVLKMELESLGLQQTVKDLGIMDHQIDMLIRLIGDFLDVSRIKAGKLEYQQETFALDPFVQQMIVILQRISSHHTILLTGKSHTSIIGDRERLGQVLVNLVTNAIKYAPETDTIEVHIASTTDTVTISVQDHEIGIPQEHQQKIFERFYRVSTTTGPAVSGLGMGLYISSEIVQRHNGKIWVESDEGQGARFSFSLPILTLP